MKLFKTKLRLFALAAGSLAITMAGANAANSFYAPGDLVLFFQQEGGTNTVYANLGNAATVFRGSATGASGSTNLVNFLDINATLISAFGSGWATNTTIYAGLAGVWGTSSSSNTLTDGDPHRTLYVSSARNSVGTVGQANSTGWDLGLAGDTAMSSGATGIATQNNVFENNYNVAQVVSDTTTSGIDNANPFSSPTIQGPAFGGAFSGGVQQVGSASTIGTIGTGTGTAEFALDLWRVQAKNAVVGQVGFGETLRLGTFEGTVSVNTSGQVSFTAVPEPSTYALLGLSALVIGFFIRRHRARNL